MSSTGSSDVVRVGRDRHVFAFGPDMVPAVEVDPGTVLHLDLNDCYFGQVRTEEDTPDTLDDALVNAATGPVAVRGALPGDTLVVDLLEIRTGNQGAATLMPGRGQLGHLLDKPATRILRVEDDLVHLGDVTFPTRPMVGVIGVATGGEVAPTLDAGPHGGNLDDNLNAAGSAVWLPVRQPGAMLAIGDMHAAMGDGEVSGTGVEIDGQVLVRVSLVRGVQPHHPVTVTPTHWVTHGTAVEDLPAALDAACEEAGKLLVDEWGFTVEDAFVFLSVACDAGIAQAVHPCPGTVIAKVKVPRVDACPLPFRPR